MNRMDFLLNKDAEQDINKDLPKLPSIGCFYIDTEGTMFPDGPERYVFLKEYDGQFLFRPEAKSLGTLDSVVKVDPEVFKKRFVGV